jgi:SagB-type dehydrogenase family enzyme
VLTVDDHPHVVSSGRRVRRPAATFRRSPHLVVYWRNGSLRICNYATNHTVAAGHLVCELLDFCNDWRSIDDMAGGLSSGPSPQISALVEKLVSLTLLERSDMSTDRRVHAMDRLGPWNPEAGFFHMATRDVVFSSPQKAARYRRQERIRRSRPAAVKRYAGVEQIDLPRPDADGEFPRVLLARRTWRRYSSNPVRLDELATILGLTAGVQHWVQADGHLAPLKTFPSGGARHALECYVVARKVQGLKAGIYHYASDRHSLERLRGPVSIQRLRAYMPTSPYFANASAIVFFTAVFERILWRYPYSRAYRAALVEAGHVCQTFCLTATWRGLAPYCIMGLADSLIERDLGIDGITESVLYAAGVGRPPRGATWAALPKGRNPKLRKNPRL